MPNWCHNTLEVRGDEKDLHEWVERASSFVPPDDPQADPQPLWFEAFYPAPDEEDFDWYSRHWGTKWDACFSDPLVSSERKRAFSLRQGEARYRFDTAWAPPTLWLEKVAGDFPRLRFSMTFGEPGMDFGGRVEYHDGEIIDWEEGLAGDYLGKGDMWF